MHVVNLKRFCPTARRVVVPACTPAPHPAALSSTPLPTLFMTLQVLKNCNIPHLQRSRQISLSDISVCYPKVSPSMWVFNMEKCYVFVF